MVSQASQIFNDLVETSRLGQDRELMALLQLHNADLSTLYREVDQLIKQLNLQEFDSFSNGNDETTISKKSNGFGKSVVSDSLSVDTLKVSPQEVPKLTKTQRRMSFDLMQIRPRTHSTLQALLGRPPEAVVSNVSVATIVTELEKKGYTPVAPKAEKNTFKDKIISYQNRFKLVNQAKERRGKSVGGPSEASKVQTGSTKVAGNTSETENQDNKNPEPISARPNSRSGPFAARRVSLVGENLPLYIRKQLQQALESAQHLESTPVPDSHSQVFSSPVQLQSGQVTANDVVESPIDSQARVSESESLQLKNNDSESTDVSYLNGMNDSAVSDGDREYILPSSFNRFLDYGDAKSLDSNDSLSEEDQDDDEDDYLFNSQAIF